MSSPLEDLTESPPTTIHSLPLETIIHIMSHAEDADILSAALVCRTWRNPAQKALVRDLRSGLATERWAQGPSASRLGDDVRSVEGIHIRVDVLLPVILQCGQLRGLVLTVSNNATWSLLRHPRLAGLRFLSITSTSSDLIHPPTKPPPFRLTAARLGLELVIANASGWRRRIDKSGWRRRIDKFTDAIIDLLSESSQTLESLTLVDYIGYRRATPDLEAHELEPLERLVATLPTSLKRLTLLSEFTNGIDQTILRPLRHLETLTITLPRSDISHLISHLNVTRRLRAISDTLQSNVTGLVFYIEDQSAWVEVEKRYGQPFRVTLESLAAFVEHPALAHVRRIEFPQIYPVSLKCFTGSYNLVEVCKERSISVRLADGSDARELEVEAWFHYPYGN